MLRTYSWLCSTVLLLVGPEHPLECPEFIQNQLHIRQVSYVSSTSHSFFYFSVFPILTCLKSSILSIPWLFSWITESKYNKDKLFLKLYWYSNCILIYAFFHELNCGNWTLVRVAIFLHLVYVFQISKILKIKFK